MQTSGEKVRENLVRRQLARRGYRLERSRQRDPGGLTFGKYRIAGGPSNVIVAGYEGPGRAYAWDLDAVELWIAGR